MGGYTYAYNTDQHGVPANPIKCLPLGLSKNLFPLKQSHSGSPNNCIASHKLWAVNHPHANATDIGGAEQ